ncbi:IucA/IucC family protein [Larsenimonas suaedae]|uniref:IucA/IucC family protein n=1 Tax=Larsenimonas suaedae TaxID=1851019 RepID=A0ABU1GRN5_9GAMM|nr:IucA/IucC family protein [Larsenimonas suaedae]MCM2972528.1 IucA/IucC family siderophore biosynthesis protein [Larsenimonas suaedae]MDR5894676.1 IucA/IucC family protein [Larsenimonas suaedae]
MTTTSFHLSPLSTLNGTPSPFLAHPDHWRHFSRIERRVVSQLLQTLLYEQVLPFEVAELGEGRHRFSVVLSSGARLVATGRLCESFELIRLDRDPGAVFHGTDGQARPLTLATLLEQLDTDTGALTRAPGFAQELEQTLLHDVQSAAAFERPDCAPTALSADALERYFADAHSYHPCYKSRIGFTWEDNARYGPEFGQPLGVLWLAVPAHLAITAQRPGLDREALIRALAGEAIMSRRDAYCARTGYAPHDVTLLPVHPWQWRAGALRALYPQLAQGEAMLLGEGEARFVPQQSIRTLAPANTHLPYLKLAMSLTNTSSTRLLARHTVANAPLITGWLKRLVAADPAAQEAGFVLLGEVAGMSLDERVFTRAQRPQVYGALGAILRENVASYLGMGEQAVAFNGLSQCTRDDTGTPAEPFIDPWIKRYGVETWTRALLETACAPILHFLFAEGIGLEAHGQNIVLIHRDGWPTRVALKDFHDGVRFSRTHLTHPEHVPALEPVPAHHARLNANSFLETEDPAAVRDYSCDAFFFIALADLAIFLTRHYDLPEGRFWAMTAAVIRDYQQAHPEHAERFARFDVFNACYEVEALTRRRLFGDEIAQIRRVPNPLRTAGEDAR